MDESREELSTYCGILIIDGVNKAKVWKYKKDLSYPHAVVKRIANTKISAVSYTGVQKPVK